MDESCSKGSSGRRNTEVPTRYLTGGYIGQLRTGACLGRIEVIEAGHRPQLLASIIDLLCSGLGLPSACSLQGVIDSFGAERGKKKNGMCTLGFPDCCVAFTTLRLMVGKWQGAHDQFNFVFFGPSRRYRQFQVLVWFCCCNLGHISSSPRMW